MTHIDPAPRPAPLDYERFRWPVACSVACEAYRAPDDALSFTPVVEARRSARHLSPVPIGEVTQTLAFATRARFCKADDPFERVRAPAISAGALHPISTLLVLEDEGHALARYNPATHALDYLVHDEASVQRWASHCAQVLPDARGAQLVLLAERGRTDALYENGASLVWRDAGALLQMLALSCEAYGLGCCAMGVLGVEIWEALGSDERLTPVGAAALGRSEPPQA
jgi:nitroreductase